MRSNSQQKNQKREIMMKNLILAAVIIVSVSCGGGGSAGGGAPVAKQTTDLQDMNLRGKVSRMVEFRDDSWDKATIKRYTDFNDRGNITESGKMMALYRFKRQPAQIREYTPEGKLSEMIDCKTSYTNYTRYRYDDLGRVVEEQHYRSNDYSDKDMFDKKFDMVRSYKTEYKSNGGKVEKYYDGTLQHIYTYDKRGNVTVDELYRDGKLFHIAYFDYEYDKTGNIVKFVEYIPYKPDSEAKNNERRGYRRDEEISVYDSNGNKVSWEKCRYEKHKDQEHKRKMYKETYTYDQYGNQTDSQTVYEYDKAGNWIKRNDSDGKVYIREFEYYQ